MGVWYLTKSDTHTARQVNYVVKGGKLWKDGETVPGSATGTCVWDWVGWGWGWDGMGWLWGQGACAPVPQAYLYQSRTVSKQW